MKKYILIIFIGVLALSSCEDFFESDSSNVLITDGKTIGTEKDALYAMSGILQHLQVIGDNWVIANELRGDLLTVTHNASQDLHDINNFEVTPQNPYLNDRAYYALINDCNYLIKYIDTSYVVINEETKQAEKVLMKEMSATKAIRAWAYMQLAMTYGSVYYSTEPILDVTQDFSGIPKIEMETLVDYLLKDLSEWIPADGVREKFPTYFETHQFIPIRLVLGDLYMWKKDYYKAANMYYQIIRVQGYDISKEDEPVALLVKGANEWRDNQFLNYGQLSWAQNSFSAENVLSIIPHTDDYAESTTILANIFGRGYYWLAPSSAAINNWASQTYVVSATINTTGDLRGHLNSPYNYFGSYYSDNSVVNNPEEVLYPVVNKYNFNENTTYLLRGTTVYLRYAEAINRLGKHTMAFAFLKNGLNASTLNSSALVSQSELAGKEPFLDFGNITPGLIATFKDNIGMHARGCGDVTLNAGYVIPAGVDTLIWVEDQIVMESALETAFEGNRFGDLMRVANHRDDDTYLAKMVASKFPAGQRETMEQKLSDRNNWFFPESELKK